MINLDNVQFTAHQALINPWFKIFTRNALDIALAQGLIPEDYSAIVLDIDKLKKANEDYGKQGSSLRIRQSLDRYKDLAYTYFSGDEIVLFCSATDALGMCNRLQSDFHENGLSATFVIGNCECGDWVSTLDYLSNVNDAVKGMGCRDCIKDFR
jgi:hypothetical protein